MEFWVKPSFPFLKLNVVGAVNLHIGLRGLGVVFRNKRGELLLVVSKGIHGHFSATTKIYVVAMGLHVLYHAGFYSENIILEMDA